MGKRLEKWRLQSRRSDHIKVTELWLYPELDCSACVDDVYLESGADQLAYYCDYVRRRYSHWWDADAVPIYWSVRGDSDGFGSEQAPFDLTRRSNILTYYHPPVSVRTGDHINWYRLPVINDRFPKFAAALGWLPAPGQLSAPLRSIIAGTPQRARRIQPESVP
jgi:hypothetical protein